MRITLHVALDDIEMYATSNFPEEKEKKEQQ